MDDSFQSEADANRHLFGGKTIIQAKMEAVLMGQGANRKYMKMIDDLGEFNAEFGITFTKDEVAAIKRNYGVTDSYDDEEEQ